MAVAQRVKLVEKPEGAFLETTTNERVFFMVSGSASLVIASPGLAAAARGRTPASPGDRPGRPLTADGPLSSIRVSPERASLSHCSMLMMDALCSSCVRSRSHWSMLGRRLLCSLLHLHTRPPQAQPSTVTPTALTPGTFRLQVTAYRLEGSMLMREGATGSEGSIRRPASASAMMQRPFGTGRSLGAEPPPEARVLAKLEPGDVFGGGSLLLDDKEVPDRLGMLAASDVKLYAIAAADLQRRGSPELWRHIKEEVGSHAVATLGTVQAAQGQARDMSLYMPSVACSSLLPAAHQSLPRHGVRILRFTQMLCKQNSPTPSPQSRSACFGSKRGLGGI